MTGWSILFLVLLRIAIGWHFFYEGIWKLKQDGWQATSYLVVAQGPLRNIFRGATPLPVIGPMVEDVDGLDAMSADGAKARIERRYTQLVKHYGLTEGPVLKKITEFKDSRQGAAEQDPKFEDTLKAASGKLVDSIYGDFAAAMRARVTDDGQPVMTPDEAQAKAIIDAALTEHKTVRNDPNLQAYRPGGAATGDADSATAAALTGFLLDRDYQPRLELRKAGFQNEVRAFKLGFIESIVADEDYARELADYKAMLAEVDDYEGKLGTMKYEGERMMDMYGRKAKAKNALLARIQKPMADMDSLVLSELQGAYFTAKVEGKPDADQIQAQLAKALPRHRSPTWWIDWANMLALTGVGIGLMLGLFTRLSALGGVGLLMLYYWCMPSFPWLPEAGPQEGHYLFINKNIIEALALLVIATSGVGRWAGIDAFLFRKRRLAVK